jgi:hypothetical protein
VAQNGTMTTSYIMSWVNDPFRALRGVFHLARPAVLIMDSYGCHLKKCVRDALKALSTVPVFIPKRVTHFMQPLDLTINAVYKKAPQRQWAEWYASDVPKELTAQNNLRKPSQQVCACYASVFINRANRPSTVDMVSKALGEVQSSTIQAAFQSCGISNTWPMRMNVLNDKLQSIMTANTDGMNETVEVDIENEDDIENGQLFEKTAEEMVDENSDEIDNSVQSNED